MAGTKRRHSGEGSIYRETSSGRWAGVVDLGFIDGRRVRRKVTGTSAKTVAQRLNKLRRETDQGVVSDSITVEGWLKYWLANIAVHKLKQGTLDGYRWQCEKHIIPRIGKRRLRSLTPDHVREMHESQRRAKLSATSIRQTHAVLRSAIGVALKEGKVGRNVAELASPAGARKNPHPVLTMPQALDVIRAAKGDVRLRARLTVALETGLRQGEVLGLLWSDLELGLNGGFVHARQSVRRVKGQGLVVGTLKTDGSYRSVPLVGAAPSALIAWREASGGKGYVFHGHGGPLTPEDPRRDYQVWTDALVAAEVPHVPLHGARGSTATILQARGVSDRVIADILGHTKVQTSQEHYLHSDEPQRVAAMHAGFGDWRELLELDPA